VARWDTEIFRQLPTEARWACFTKGVLGVGSHHKGSGARRGLFASIGVGVGALTAYDLTQRTHSILRNYPVAGHMRYALESIRPELQQYFIERNFDGRPFDRDTRTVVYSRAKGQEIGKAFGSERDLEEPGYNFLVHSNAPVEPSGPEPRVRLGGPECSRPYDISLLNISAMSFGSLSARAVRAMNKGAAMGGFAQDTGEGGLTDYHLEYGADLMWELGTGYFSARTPDGHLDRDEFRRKAQMDEVKAITIKISQGAKPGMGGMLPGAKVNAEIARYRGVPEGEDCLSPSAHKEFSTPIELVEFIAELRRLSGGKPVGFKICFGSRREVLSICKAIIDAGSGPDYILVDGSEGGTGAAPQEFTDHVGMPLREGLITLHNALTGSGLRDTISIGASGKVAQGNDIVRRLIQGADFTMSARAMMMATGCIQAQKCHTGKCPVGVATQSARRQRALDVVDKGERVRRYHEATIAEARRIMGAMGASRPSQLDTTMLRQVLSPIASSSYAEIYEWLSPGQLLDSPPESWAADWAHARADSF
jgi:glutamate synthase domain-containing protein 2